MLNFFFFYRGRSISDHKGPAPPGCYSDVALQVQPRGVGYFYSHSVVPGGFAVRSYMTALHHGIARRAASMSTRH